MVTHAPSSEIVRQDQEGLAGLRPGASVYVADRNPALVYLARLAESSRRPQKQSLTVIADLVQPGAAFDVFPWHALRYQHTQAIRTKLAEKYSASTANRHIAALRGVLKECWRLGYMSAEEYQRTIDIELVSSRKAPQSEKGRHIQRGEFKALIDTCLGDKPTNAGIRDACLIIIGYIGGFRRAELVALQLADYDAEACTLTVQRGKGNKERVIPLAAGACEALDDWLAVRGSAPGPLFLHVSQGDNIVREDLSPQAVYDILTRRAKAAGVKAFSPHDLRRTFAGDLLDAGADIVTVQKLMGHANANTTAGYDRRDARTKREAVNRLHIYYKKQK